MTAMVLFFLISQRAFGQVVSTQQPDPDRLYTRDEMFNITVEAAQKRPDVALLLKNSEDWFWHQAKDLGLSQNLVVPVASVIAPLVYHKISTRTFHMDWRPRPYLTLRPDLDYFFDPQEVNLAFTATWRF